MNSKLYLECYYGISGDMMAAALLDLGANQEVLNKSLKSLKLKGFETKISRVHKAGLDACDFAVILDEKHENHDYDMNYLYGKADYKGHTAAQHHKHGLFNEHRSLSDIINIINQAEITELAKELAVRIFTILAKAEAKAHGVEINQVHFHEVGAVDSIVDIVAVAVCLDNLGIEEVIVPVLYDGTGFIRCQHGIIPIPVPAVSNIAADYGLALHIIEAEGEFITPTGAAIVAAIKTADKLSEQFSIQKIGIGAGKRNYERPSILRAMLIH